MFKHPDRQPVRPPFPIPSFFHRRIIPVLVRSLTAFLFLTILQSIGCAIIHPPSSKEVFSLHDAGTVTAEIRNQWNKVSSFYTSGTVLMKDWKWESEADILIAGVRDPFKIKIEITHSWGKPILHILIDNDRLEALSFNEKRLYIGDFTSDALSRFLPGSFFDRPLTWSVLRGYPHLLEYKRVEIREMNTIDLSDWKGNVVEIIELDPKSRLPERVYFPDHKLSLAFSGFMNNDGIYYASEVKVNSVHGGKDLIIKNRKMVFNKAVPEQIFRLEKIPGFETVFLKEIQDMKWE